jgi:surface antigen
MADPADSLGDVLADTSSKGYSDTSINRFTYGQCTWYCCGRAYEKKGVNLSSLLPQPSNAGDWYNNIETNSNVTKRDKSKGPIVDSIAVFSGHVLYIEAIRSNNIYFTECNWHTPGNKEGQVQTDKGDLILKSTDDWSNFVSERGTLNGFIVVR